jgi:putative transposase
MEWTHIPAYITGIVDQELLLRNEYLAAENRILMAKLNGRPRFSDVERATLGEIGFRLGRGALKKWRRPPGVLVGYSDSDIPMV